ncbi:MAG: hypothetical protein ACRCYX_13045 [Dermatophilaceae bacterium]
MREPAEYAVVFFGHRAVEAAQAGFEVREGDADGVRGQCPGQG